MDASEQLKYPLEFYEFTVDGLLRTAIAAYEQVDRLSDGSDPGISQKIAELKAR